VKVSFLKEEAPESGGDTSTRLVVPASAVRTSNGQSVVFVAAGDRVERRAIKTGGEDGGQVDVLSGLRPGERVVLDAPATMKDGDRIEVR
jgi:multidrug efflux pump subunit AcrA (membrane-fusion protein)